MTHILTVNSSEDEGEYFEKFLCSVVKMTMITAKKNPTPGDVDWHEEQLDQHRTGVRITDQQRPHILRFDLQVTYRHEPDSVIITEKICSPSKGLNWDVPVSAIMDICYRKGNWRIGLIGDLYTSLQSRAPVFRTLISFSCLPPTSDALRGTYHGTKIDLQIR